LSLAKNIPLICAICGQNKISASLRLKNKFSGHRRYFLFPSLSNGVALTGNSGFPIISCKDDKKREKQEKQHYSVRFLAKTKKNM
jgi:hypothetical protein